MDQGRYCVPRPLPRASIVLLSVIPSLLVVLVANPILGFVIDEVLEAELIASLRHLGVYPFVGGAGSVEGGFQASPHSFDRSRSPIDVLITTSACVTWSARPSRVVFNLDSLGASAIRAVIVFVSRRGHGNSFEDA